MLVQLVGARGKIVLMFNYNIRKYCFVHVYSTLRPLYFLIQEKYKICTLLRTMFIEGTHGI